MNKRYNAQRKHIVHSLDSLLYQLHTLSFFLSPGLWAFIFRLVSQFQCSKPRDLDAAHSLRFFFTTILFFNIPTLWNHATSSGLEERAVFLDFVGLAYVPSRLQLFALDFVIVFLQFLLTTIAYEMSLTQGSTDNDVQDTLLPTPPGLPPVASSSSTNPLSSPIKPPPSSSTDLVLDLRLSTVIARLRSAAPRPRPISSDAFLPLPNTTPWPLPAGMRMLMRASAQMRRDAAAAEADMVGNRGERRIPGAMNREGS
ncbi:hypothetical protein BDN72DRAFT_810981 [Pluteus cervinus]|uniref:Uncharacterized protein n=1 Tax=Pluteus cervinus TaxID=181527 RepID=A0ACD3BCR2_9AGAR|nr:hypothetical protein BDN72DRAFT_810981 [Pluteus cervinus]